jgi:hypothetical protein
MIKNLMVSSRPGGSARSREADRTETVHEHTRLSCLIIQFDSAFDVLAIALLDSGANKAGGPRRP